MTTDLCVVVGAPRSGTTWLQRLLAASPSVASPQESHLFHNYLRPQQRVWRRETEKLDRTVASLSAGRPPRDRVIGLATILDEDDLVAGQRYLVDRVLTRAVETKPSARVVVEKTPSNSLCVDLVDRLCPDARFVHIVRDPRDVMASLRDARDGGWGESWVPSDPMAMARTWLRHVDGARAAAGFGRGRYLEVRYERLRAEPAATLGRILEFLDLPDNPAALVDAERNARDAPIGELFAIEPGLAGRLASFRDEEPHGFRSNGRAALDRPARRAAEIVLGETARALGYTDGWDRVSPLARRVWLPRLRAGSVLNNVRRRRWDRGRVSEKEGGV